MDDWKRRLFDGYVSSGQSAAGRSSDHHLRRLVRRFAPRDRSAVMADLACGRGDLLACLKAMGYSAVSGVDISPEQVQVAHVAGLMEVEQGEIAAYLANRRAVYDALFMMDILEHLPREELLPTLDLVHAALKPGGVLILRVPNGEGLAGMGIRYGDLTHETCFTRHSLAQLLRSAGFSDVAAHEVRPVVHGPVSLLRRILWDLLTLPARLLRAAEAGGGGAILSQNLLATARKPA